MSTSASVISKCLKILINNKYFLQNLKVKEFVLLIKQFALEDCVATLTDWPKLHHKNVNFIYGLKVGMTLIAYEKLSLTDYIFHIDHIINNIYGNILPFSVLDIIWILKE